MSVLPRVTVTEKASMSVRPSATLQNLQYHSTKNRPRVVSSKTLDLVLTHQKLFGILTGVLRNGARNKGEMGETAAILI